MEFIARLSFRNFQSNARFMISSKWMRQNAFILLVRYVSAQIEFISKWNWYMCEEVAYTRAHSHKCLKQWKTIKWKMLFIDVSCCWCWCWCCWCWCCSIFCPLENVCSTTIMGIGCICMPSPTSISFTNGLNEQCFFLLKT